MSIRISRRVLAAIITAIVAPCAGSLRWIGVASAEAPPAVDLPPIFNGKDLDGWRVAGAPYWRVVDGG